MARLCPWCLLPQGECICDNPDDDDQDDGDDA